MDMIIKLGTFDFPGSGCTPTSAYSYETDGERFWILPRDEWNGLSLATSGDDAGVPAYPEAAEFVAIQDIRRISFELLRFGSVFSDHTLRVAPATDENL